MKRAMQSWLLFRAFYELARYEALIGIRGSGHMLRQLRALEIAGKPPNKGTEQTVCDAVLLATCFYWKPVLCLQRSVCLVRLLRMHGVPARLVIGYRPSPFFSHAWVEVAGRVVNGSQAYRTRLSPLHVV
jgi:hypothetical protein